MTEAFPKFHHPRLHEAAVEVAVSVQVAALTIQQIDADIQALTNYLRHHNVRVFAKHEISEGEILAWAPQGDLKLWDLFWSDPRVDKPVSLAFAVEGIRRRAASHLPALLRAIAEVIA
jgi:hypothetical protein